MDRRTLEANIAERGTMLCVGLDPVLDRLPAGIPRTIDGVVTFCMAIIDATRPYCVAYKPNLAFFECLGVEGMSAFAKTCEYIGEEHLIIADAKRGDIGNTATRYAETFYDRYGCDAVTVAPYMGRDSVEPFLRPGKWAVVLGLTSNAGSADFEQQLLADGDELWERVIKQCVSWGTPDNLMLVTGATKPEKFERIRELAPDHFLLVPGIGAQGGDLAGVLKYGAVAGGGLLINSSRGIIYKSEGNDFAEAAGQEARRLAQTMRQQMK